MSDTAVPPLFAPVSTSSRHLSAIVWLIAGVATAIVGGWFILLVAFSSTGSHQGDALAQTTPIRVFGDYVPQARQVPWPEFDRLLSVSGAQLQAKLEAEAKKYPDQSIAISVRAITDPEHIAFQEDRIFAGASTTKLITAAAVLSMVDNHKVGLTDKLGDKTVEYHLKLMINQSNNNSWELLNNLVGLRDLQKYAEEIGLQGFKVNGNTINANTLAVFLQMLYRYELLSDQSTELLLGWMTKTNDEAMLPQVFADSDHVYHKYGWFGSSLHDAAIVVHRGQPFVIVIMTDGAPNYAQGKAIIRQLAEVVSQSLK